MYILYNTLLNNVTLVSNYIFSTSISYTLILIHDYWNPTRLLNLGIYPHYTINWTYTIIRTLRVSDQLVTNCLRGISLFLAAWLTTHFHDNFSKFVSFDGTEKEFWHFTYTKLFEYGLMKRKCLNLHEMECSKLFILNTGGPNTIQNLILTHTQFILY